MNKEEFLKMYFSSNIELILFYDYYVENTSNKNKVLSLNEFHYYFMQYMNTIDLHIVIEKIFNYYIEKFKLSIVKLIDINNVTIKRWVNEK